MGGRVNYRWKATLGRFIEEDDNVRFVGEIKKYADRQGPSIGNYICDQTFAGGEIHANIRFAEVAPDSACHLICYFNTNPFTLLVAGLSANANQFWIQTFSAGQWTTISASGDPANLSQDVEYDVRATVRGSEIILTVDGVDVASGLVPSYLHGSQVGIWCSGYKDIYISDFSIKTVKPRAFVVMQFSPPFDQVHEEVISKVCEEFGLETLRADDTYGPGLIVTDIAQQIIESTLVIAEITPVNANVYYEVGYAHALGKPTILIATKGTQLPFDVSPFRTLFYENTISGKRRVEEQLRRHLTAIVGPARPSRP